jgi:hypothetical protein
MPRPPRVTQAARATSIRRKNTRVVAAVMEQFWQAKGVSGHEWSATTPRGASGTHLIVDAVL